MTQRRTKKPTLDDLLSVRTPVDIVASPDGEMLAVTAELKGEWMMIPNGSLKSGVTTFEVALHLFVIDLKTGNETQVDSGHRSWKPTWSNDAERLVFFSEQNEEIGLWEWERASGKVRRLIDEAIPRSFQILGWDAKGTGVIVVLPSSGQDAKGSEPPPAQGPQVDYFYSSSKGEDEVSGVAVGLLGKEDKRDVAVVNIESGEVKRIVEDFPLVHIHPSPDGRWVALIGPLRRLKMESFKHVQDIHIFSVDDGKLMHVIKDSRHMIPSWSPDSSKLAAVCNGKLVVQRIEGDVADLDQVSELYDEGGGVLFWTALWDDTSRMILAPNLEPRFLAIDTESGSYVELDKPYTAQFRAPNPFRSARLDQFWSPDGSSCVFATRNAEDLSRELWRVPLDGSPAAGIKDLEAESMPVPDLVHPGATEISTDGDNVYYRTDNEVDPPEIWSLNQQGKTKRISKFNDHLADMDLAKAESITWPNADGTEWKGTLVLPASRKPGETVPIVVDSYPVPAWGHMTDQWDSPQVIFKQLLVAQGYGVFVVGGALASKLSSLQDLCNPILTGVNELQRLGIADDRLAIMGQSGGGFLVNSMVTVTDRFKAAISFVSVANWASHFGQLWPMEGGPLMHGVTNAENVCGGPPWEKPDRYVQLSPVFYLDRVETPLLLVSGLADSGVFVQQADEMFVGLRRLGKEVGLLRYHGEGHGGFSEPNRSDMIERVLAFLDKHLAVQTAGGQ